MVPNETMKNGKIHLTDDECSGRGFARNTSAKGFFRLVKINEPTPKACLVDALSVDTDKWETNKYVIAAGTTASWWTPKHGVICKPMKTFD